MNIDLELWKFNDIFFEEATHAYTDSLGTAYTSVTHFIEEFCPQQDWDEKALNKAWKIDYDHVHEKVAEANTEEKKMFCRVAAALKLREEWKASGDKACTLGTQVHAFMENQWKRKLYVPEHKSPDFDAVAATGLKAYQELAKRFVPIREEFIVYNAAWQLCGTIDFLAYDTLKDRIVILDYKTNKEIRRESDGQCIGILQGLPDCNYVHYSAQLSTYKAILESQTSLRVGGMALVHLRKDGYSVIPCQDYSAEIRGLLDGRAQKR